MLRTCLITVRLSNRHHPLPGSSLLRYTILNQQWPIQPIRRAIGQNESVSKITTAPSRRDGYETHFVPCVFGSSWPTEWLRSSPFRSLSSSSPSFSTMSRKRSKEEVQAELDEKWHEMYEKVKQYATQYPTHPQPKDSKLRTWLNRQRYFYQQSVHPSNSNSRYVPLSPTRRALLEQLPYPMEPLLKLAWDTRYQQLVEFIQQHNGRSPTDYRPSELSQEYRPLLDWCYKQKTARYNSRNLSDPVFGVAPLSPEREARLNALGFCWSQRKSVWDERFDELKAYRDKNGDCMVPEDYPLNPALASWVAELRYHYNRYRHGKSSSMTEERVQRLASLDFEWDAMEAKWMKRYRELEKHVAVYGLGVWPKARHNPSLESWLKLQRRHYQAYLRGAKTTMTSQRLHRLNMLGFFVDLSV